MKKLMFAVIGALALSSAVGAADGPLTEYTHTKANAPSKAEYVRHTNVVEVATKISTEIVREYSTSNAVNGADHPLPAYLHYLKFDDVYADDAQRYYDMIDQGGLGASILKKGKKNRSNIGMFRSPVGLCSVRRMDNIVERDYDWHFNDTPSFVVEVSGIANVRYASIGVAEIGTNLTEEVIASQKGNWYYKCLPGSMLDGINEKGVMAELNVVPANGADWETKGSRDINGHGGIRWILDNAASAGFAASNIAERAYIPKALKDLGFSLHYMICDKDETWIVEDGVAHLCQETIPVMTNYRLYMNDGEEDLYGSGYARAEILRDRNNPITDVWYTKGFAKTVDGIAWPDELAGVEVDGRKLTKNDTDELQNFAREKLWGFLPPTRNAINPVTGENLWWQTIHCAKYDLTRKSFQIAVQENPDWYTFALSSTSTDEGEVRKLANEEIDKRDFQGQISNAESNANAYADRIKENLVNNEIKAVGDRVTTNENKLTGLTKDTVVEEITDKVNSLKNGDVKANTDRISALETEAGKNTSRLEGIGESETVKNLIDGVEQKVKELLGPAHVDNKEVTLGGGATNVNHLEAVTINGSARYPSYTYGFSNINIGLDNITGYGDDGVGGVINSKGVIESGKAYYDVVIGTSSSAKYMHSYVFGSQAHASAPNSLITGYGATVTNSDSVIIGFGFRPQADKKFNTRAEMLTWFRSFTSKTAATNAIPFVDYMISITNDTALARNPVSYNGDYYVKSIRSAKDATYGWVELYQDAPHDERDEYIRGRHNWDYGKSHGKGTVNLVAKGSTGKDPGLSAVYINDRSLSELTGIRNGEPVYKPMYNKGIWTDPVLSPADMTIAIGDNAHATETNKSCQSIAIGRDSLSAGSATVVVGPNGFAEGAQAIAVGWRANAVGAHSISIGSAKKSGEDYYKDGDVNPNSDLQLAKGDYSVAIGYNNKSLAKDSISVGNGSKVAESAVGAVQLGAGENTEANTLKFQNVTIVKDGHVVGSTPDPKTEQVAPSGDVTVEPGSMTTLLPTEGTTFPEEIGITCTGSRNFTMYIPNLPEIREAGPWGIDTELPSGVSAAYYKDKKFVSKLPAKVTVEQPYSGLVVFKFEELESTFDWTPCVTNCAITYSEGKFVTEGSNSLLGESLHMCTNYKLVYTTDSNVVVTNDLMKLKNSGDAYITGTLYKGPSSVQYVCPAGQMPKLRDGEIIDFEVIYETVNGRAYFKNADGTKSDKIVKSINIAE